MFSDLRGQRQFWIAQPRCGLEQHLTGLGLAAARHDVLPGLNCPLDHHSSLRRFGVFDHHHRVSAGWHSRAGHDLYALAGADHTSKRIARFDFSNNLKGAGARPHVLGADSKAVAGRAVKGRIIAVGYDPVSKDAVKGLSQLRKFRRRSPATRSGHFDDLLARMVVRKHHGYRPEPRITTMMRVSCLAGQS